MDSVYEYCKMYRVFVSWISGFLSPWYDLLFQALVVESIYCGKSITLMSAATRAKNLILHAHWDYHLHKLLRYATDIAPAMTSYSLPYKV